MQEQMGKTLEINCESVGQF